MRKYRAEKNGKGYRIAQEDTLEFADDTALETYLQKIELELDRVRKQRVALDVSEKALVNHITEVRQLMGTGR